MSEITLTLSGMTASEPTQTIMSTQATEPTFSQKEVLTATALALAQAEQLTPSESQQVEAFVAQIDLRDSLSLLRYGESAQRKLTGFTDGALKSVLGRDLSEISDLLQNMVQQIQNLTTVTVPNRLFGAFRPGGQQNSLRAQYTEVSKALDRNRRELDGWRLKLLVDIKTLDTLYNQLVDYHKELAMYIQAGQQKLVQAQTDELTQLQQRVDLTGDQTDILALNDFGAKCDTFSGRLHDLAQTKMISLQTATQIQLVQNVNRRVVLQIQSSISNAVAAWQQGVAIALTAERSQQALSLHNRELISTLNNALATQRESDQLKSAAVSGELLQTS